MSYLVLENINKHFGAYHALRDVNLSAEAGDFVVLLGPSGCGKSTLLRLITGLIDDFDGEIFLKDKNVSAMDPKDRKVAMVFQSYALYPHLTVERNISFGMEVNRVAKATRAARVAEAARALQLEPLLKRFPSQLSGGQRQRVAIARCLVREPDLFLFDEPLSNLDAKLRHETRVELKQLHQRLGTTTVYVTHDQHEAMTLGTKVVLMKDGEIVQSGAPMDLYNQPANLFAATFIGSPQINLLPGEVEATADGARFTSGSLVLDLPQTILRSAFTGRRPAQFGIRAESVLAGDTNAHLHLPVTYVEATGADLFVNGRLGETDLVFRLPKLHAARSGETLPLSLDLSQGFLFDSATGERL